MHPSGRRLWKKWLTCGASALLFAVVAVFFYFYRQLIYLGGNIEISVVFSQLFWKAFLVGLIGFFCFFAILFFGYRLLQPFGNFLYRWRYMVSRYGFVCLCVAQFKRLFYWLLEWNPRRRAG
jgi:hypothetical protein